MLIYTVKAFLLGCTFADYLTKTDLMKQLMTKFLVLFIGAFILLPSCKDDETPITSGSSVTITNTLQADAITGGGEQTIEELFMMDAGALAATATVSDAVEFSDYLLGLYDVDIDETSISFTLVAAADNPDYSSFFRTLEAGTTDRYYLTFTEDQNVTSATSNTSAVNLRIDSDRVLVVEIGEGFNFNPGSSFTITLE